MAAVYPIASADIMAGLTAQIAHADGEIAAHHDAANIWQVHRWRGFRDVMCDARARLDGVPSYQQAATLMRYVAHREIVIEERRAQVTSDLMERQGKRDAITHIRWLCE